LLAGFPLFTVIVLFQLNPLSPSETILAIGWAANAILMGYLIYFIVKKTANRLKTFMHPTGIAQLGLTSLIGIWIAAFSALLASLGSIKTAALTLAGVSALAFLVFHIACFLLHLFRSKTRH
jgi:hypothetical protein